MKEPLIHSHFEDGLPDNHLLAHQQITCSKCRVLVHARNNECMQTWIETYRGNFCTACMPLEPVLQIPWVEPFLSER
jgi:hypothetical protein